MVEYYNPTDSPRPNGYTHAVKINRGKIVFISGQVSLDAEGKVVGERDYGVQANQVFKNIGKALDSVGATYKDIVKLTFFVVDIGHLPEIRVARDRYIDATRPPASTAVQVAALFRPEILLEIEAVAAID